MFTRSDYLGGKCNHRQYYSQIVSPALKEKVVLHIGLIRLLESKEENFNDIPLRCWDSVFCPLSHYWADKFRELGDFPSIAGLVCVAKEAALQAVEDHRKGGRHD